MKVRRENFEKFMKAHKLNKTQFCKNCNISVKTYNNLMSGSNPHVITVVKIAKYTNFKVQDIFFWS